MKRAKQEQILDAIVFLACLLVVSIVLVAILSCTPPAYPVQPDCHAEETVSVVCERRLGECLDTLRIAKRVVTRYEDGANVCRTMGVIENE